MTSPRSSARRGSTPPTGPCSSTLETAWGYGDETFDGSWGWSFDYDICCEPGPVTGGKAL